MIIYIDGGSRGNPGQAACSAIFADEKGRASRQYSEALGITTNNIAEYKGLVLALKKAKALLGKAKAKNTEIEIRSDSELLVKQMSGEYKITNPDIQQLFLKAWNLKIDFKKVVFSAIPREENKQADRLVNETLDVERKSQKLF